MEEKKRFQKQIVNSDEHQALDNGAKAAKGFLGTVIAAITLYCNRENLKALAKNAADLVRKVK